MTEEAGEHSIAELILRDHEVIRDLIDRFDSAPTGDWVEVFSDLVQYVVRHELAEEEVVLPVVRRLSEKGDRIADECLLEQARAQARLEEMGRLSPASVEFRDELGHLKDDISNHAAQEQQAVIPLLEDQSAAEGRDLARRYELARMAAPASPRLLGEDPPADGVHTGRIAAVAERVRAAIRDR
ncbi:MAG: hemerythrin domain-containing protein [Acidimicrobiales bacterium]